MPDLTWESQAPGEVFAGKFNAPGGAEEGPEQEPQVLLSPALLCNHRWVSSHSNNFLHKCLLLVPRGTSQARAERNKCFFFARTKCQNQSSDGGNYHFGMGLVVTGLKQTILTYIWYNLLISEISPLDKDASRLNI